MNRLQMNIHCGRPLFIAGGCLVLIVLALGCDPDRGAGTSRNGSTVSSGTGGASPRFIPMGTAPSGGAFYVVGNSIASVLNENKGSATWTVQPEGTRGTQQNIRMLDKGEAMLGMSNAAISYYAVKGEGIWREPYAIRSVATLAPNVGLFVTKRESGIRNFADLKGKRISVGPAGAGFESFLAPLFAAHGVQYSSERSDFTPVSADYTTAVQLLGDGEIDAAFMGGAIPMPAITQATSTMELFYIPFDPAAIDKLVIDFPFFQAATIPAKNAAGEPTYRGLEDDFLAINVGSMQLISHQNVNEDLIYDLTKKMWENREAITRQHPAGRSINESNVAREVGTPFHPGAIRFYKEIGILSEDSE